MHSRYQENNDTNTQLFTIDQLYLCDHLTLPNCTRHFYLVQHVLKIFFYRVICSLWFLPQKDFAFTIVVFLLQQLTKNACYLHLTSPTPPTRSQPRNARHQNALTLGQCSFRDSDQYLCLPDNSGSTQHVFCIPNVRATTPQ